MFQTKSFIKVLTTSILQQYEIKVWKNGRLNIATVNKTCSIISSSEDDPSTPHAITYCGSRHGVVTHAHWIELLARSVTGILVREKLFRGNKIFSENFGAWNNFFWKFCSSPENFVPQLNRAFSRKELYSVSSSSIATGSFWNTYSVPIESFWTWI